MVMMRNAGNGGGETPHGHEAMSKAERFSGSLHQCQKMTGMPKNILPNHYHKSSEASRLHCEAL